MVMDIGMDKKLKVKKLHQKNKHIMQQKQHTKQHKQQSKKQNQHTFHQISLPFRMVRWIGFRFYCPKSAAAAAIRSATFTPKGQRLSQPRQPTHSSA